MKTQSRRSFLQLGVGATGLSAAMMSVSACSQKGGSAAPAAAQCVDPASLTSSEQNLRNSMNYVDVSQNSGETCSVCEFFTAGDGGCGTCQMFTGAAASGTGRCDSWAARSDSPAAPAEPA